jgi:hypothetical protein
VTADRSDPGHHGARHGVHPNPGVDTAPASGPPPVSGRVSTLDRVTLQLGVVVAVLIALCSLSVAGLPVNGESGSWVLLLCCWLGVADRSRGSRWSARSNARTSDLDAGEGCRRFGERSSSLRYAIGITGEAWSAGRDRSARASSLISVLGPWSGDMMGDRVPARGGCGCSFYVGRPRPVRDDGPGGDRSIRELATPHQRSRHPSAHDASQFRRRLGVRRGPAPGRRALVGCGRPRGPACGPPTARPACHPGAV